MLRPGRGPAAGGDDERGVAGRGGVTAGRGSKCTTLRKGAYLYHRTSGLQAWKETVTC
ncbi:hypothetical protein Sdia_47360 [Streptomyces diastaticus subsp. diastaticus]|uniref:Uncharacterized protein n=1 Tax=Streptomyces diastaticus subsp. diastaticus TaxID=68040 RepID=A0ABQ1CUV6_STRDI|nr:hypothetical protein Sdia_47360 [Streptomyces diastaticus subsp. diastaticus]